MPDHRTIQLGVNVDHVATLRQARGTNYPDPVDAAEIARQAGADGITVHLREDRRHIQDFDVFKVKENVPLPLNFEMAATDEMIKIATQVQPHECCLVPEKRQELTTEGGLDVIAQTQTLSDMIAKLQDQGILVSLFIDPDEKQILASKELGVDIVELHTGTYADMNNCESELPAQTQELLRIQAASSLAHSLGLQVNAGHGLHYQNVQAIAAIPELVCLNIGHSIVARAVMGGFHEAVFTMKKVMNEARLEVAASN